jgi:hypothetical protein
MHEQLAGKQKQLNDQLATLRAEMGTMLRGDVTEDDWQPRLEDVAHQIAQLQTQHDRSSTLDGLGQIQDELTALNDRRPLLLGLEADSADGKAIISPGNPDTADHTAVWVPGMGTNLASTADNLDRIDRLQRQADLVAARKKEGDVAVVMWLGYDAPEGVSTAASSTRAEQGAPALDTFVDGLHATHGPGPEHITAVAHSYGSVLTGHAAADPRGLHVTDIVTAGSPGMDTSDFRPFAAPVSDLHIDPRHFWAGAAADDPVPWLPGHGPHPEEAAFGGNVYKVDTSGRSNYWDARVRSPWRTRPAPSWADTTT